MTPRPLRIPAHAPQRGDTIFTVSILAIAAVARLAHIACAGQGLFGDEIRIFESIQHFAASFTFPEPYYDMPFMSMFFGLAGKATGISILSMRLLLLPFSLATVWLIGEIAYLLSGVRAARFLALTVAAIYPFFIFYSARILSETPFLLFVAAFFYFLLQRKIMTATCLFALAQYTRPTMLLFLPVAAGWYIWVQRDTRPLRPLFVRSMAACLLFALLMVPWVVRNYAAHDVLMLSRPSGHTLWEGNNPWNLDGGVSQPDWGFLDDMPRDVSFFEQDKWKKRQAINYIKSHPGRFVELAIKKFFRFWRLWPNASQYQQGIFFWGSLLSFGPVLLFALTSPIVLQRRRKELIVLWLFIAYYTAIHMVFIGSLRYRLPLEPLLIGMAGASAAVLVKGRKESHFLHNNTSSHP